MEIIIFGAGTYGKVLCNYYLYTGDDKIIGIVDTYSCELQYKGIPIYKPSEILNLQYDRIIISMRDENSIKEALAILDNMQVPKKEIEVFMEDTELKERAFTIDNQYDEKTDRRVLWLKSFAKYVYDEGILGDIAECGVMRGDFAFYMNKYFPDRNAFLFDTYEGFDKRDIEKEVEINSPSITMGLFDGNKRFCTTSETIVMNKMPSKEKVHLVKGWFPESATCLDTELFCFVNLDMDLYQPMYQGLQFFAPRMVKGGVILMHDYSSIFPGVKQAVNDYENNNGRLYRFPIGDACSIAILF